MSMGETLIKIALLLVLVTIIIFAVVKPFSENQSTTIDWLNGQSRVDILEYESRSPYASTSPHTEIPEAPEDKTDLASNEHRREKYDISKSDFAEAIKVSFKSVTGKEPTEEQIKALFSITIHESGSLSKEKIYVYNWNFGNLHIPGAKEIYLKTDLGFNSEKYDHNLYSEYVKRAKKYVSENNIALPTKPYFWHADSNEVGSYYMTPFQAFDSADEGLRGKISLITRIYPDAVDEDELAASDNNKEMAEAIVYGLKNGEGGRQYFVAAADNYAKGLAYALDQFDKII